MKKYSGKSLEDCLEEASKELGITKEELMYVVEEEKKGLFHKKCVISVVEMSDIIEYAEDYVKGVCKALGLEVSLTTFYKNDLIKILVETNENSLLIGRNGETLQSLCELTKLALSAQFKRKIRVLIDIAGYKDKKYSKVISIAKKEAKQVLRTHVDVKLSPMTPDERKKVHTALASWKDIKTESVGDGKERAVVIKYVGDPNAPVKPINSKRKPKRERIRPETQEKLDESNTDSESSESKKLEEVDSNETQE